MKKAALSVWHYWLVALMLVWTLGIGLYLAQRDSLTTDETVHIASGYTALTRHDYRFDPEHPILFKAITAVPLLFIHSNLPSDDQALWQGASPILYDSWREARSWGDEWFYKSGNNADVMAFLARIPSVLTLVALCALVYWLGRLWFSPRIGLFALFFTAFNPTVLAHGHLANDDVAVAFASLVVLWATTCYCRQPNWQRALWLGLSLGLAILTKFSAVVLVIIVVAFFLYKLLRRQLPLQCLAQLGVSLAVAWLLIWMVYLFHIRPGAESFGWIRFFGPTDFIKGFVLVQLATQIGRPVYLLGEIHSPGLWYYFPVIYALKTQLMGLILLIGGAWAVVRFKLNPLKNDGQFLLVLTAAVFTFFAITSKLNIGIRHIMLLLVLFSFVMAAALELIRRSFKEVGVGLTAALYMLPVFWQGNHLLGFTNIFVQPSSQAWRYTSDSNLDWGQQAKEIAQVIKNEFSQEDLYMNYFWNPYILPYYQVQVRNFDPANPPHRVLLGVTATQLTFPEYAAFKGLTPTYRIENHTFFYRLP